MARSTKEKQSWTSKPCPGCKEPGRRPADGLCADCRSKMSFANETMKDQQKRNDVVLVGLPGSYYNLPYFADGNRSNVFDHSEEPKVVFQKSLVAVVESLGREVTWQQAREFAGDVDLHESSIRIASDIELRSLTRDTAQKPKRDRRAPRPEKEYLRWGDGSSYSQRYFIVPKTALEPLNLLYRSVYEISELRYWEGRRDGGSIVARLAAGDVSVGDFNDATIEQERYG
jgi:hypothetical protein